MQRESLNTYRLSTGRLIQAPDGVIGLSPEGDVFGGGEEFVWVSDPADPQHKALTPEERIELATEMVARWTAVKLIALDDQRAARRK